jgi:ABC-type branched-subunit amino acid transport system substrate-binding protein
MTGPEAWRGEDAFEGADLAVHLLNAGADSSSERYQLVTLDDRGDPRRALDLVGQLTESDRTVGVVYAGPSSGFARLESLLAGAGIPGVLCFGDIQGREVPDRHLFQTTPPYRWQASEISSYLFRDRRYRKIGVLAGRTSSGELAVRAMLDSASRRRVKVGRYEEAADIDRLLDRFRAARVEALVVDGSPQVFSATISALARKDAAYVSTSEARTVSGRARKRLRRRKSPWRPQVVAFDSAISPFADTPGPPGTVAAESFARGAHYIPIPSLATFSSAFREWWGEEPLGWERRAFEATSLVGWADAHGSDGDDLAKVLEGLSGKRFGGLDVGFGPRDHVTLDREDLGLWVVPRPDEKLSEREALTRTMPWVPLDRAWSSRGRTTAARRDWPYLFGPGTRKAKRRPPIRRMQWGITSGRRDPLH